MLATLERILAPVDMTQRSRPVVEYAAALAEEFNAALDVLFVWELTDHWDVSPSAPTQGAQAQTRDGAADELREFLASIDLTGLRVRARLACGNVSETIVGIAEEEGHDLIVLGAPERHKLRHLLSSSVNDKVSRSAPCPVLTVRPAGADA